MKKITYLFLLVGAFAFAQFPAPYCGPIEFGVDVEPITLVNFAGINNASSNVIEEEGISHEDYTSISGAVTAGIPYTITLKGNTGGNWTNRFMVFVDWNQDGDFADPGEAYEITQTITNSTGLDAIQATQSLLVPVTALEGTTRMRVKKIFGTVDYTNPCLGAGFGQVEDYSLVVTPSSDCTGTPDPGDTISSVTSVCAGIQFSLSLQNDVAAAGITYQWQVSTNGVDYADIDGATNATYTATQNEASYYQCVVTCSFSTLSETSAPVMVGINPGVECYCTPIYTTGIGSGDLISNIVIQGTTLSNNTGVSTPGPSYTYFTGQPNYTAELQAGNSYTVEVTVGSAGGQHIAVWIDYNDNGFFETSERVGFTTTPIAAGGTATISITLACNPPLGTHRMRVRDVWSTTGANIDPCSSYTWGETEDYDITITSAVTCPQPSNLAVTSITSTSAILVWSIGCAETSWDVHFTQAGGGAPVDEPSNPNAISPFEVTGLMPITAYEFYVRANCDEDGLSLWTGPFAFTTLDIAPDCATVIFPEDAAVDVPVGIVPFSWEPANTGGEATSYDLYYGLTPDNVTIFVDNFTEPTADINLEGFNTTFYWMIVPINSGGEAMGCEVWSFTTVESPGFCLNGNLYPMATFTPGVCDGTTVNTVVEDAWAGEFSNINVVSGETYTFNSSVATDFITIGSQDGSTPIVFGTTPLSWTSDLTGVVRFYIHTNDNCETENVIRVRSIICGVASTDTPEFVNLQFPFDATITQGETATIYGQVYAAGLTDVEPNIEGQAPGIEAWVGVSSMGENTNPETWTTWIPATWNAGHVSNNDEYEASIGTGLVPGTYYYATRFSLNNGPFVYGGTNNGFWDGVTHLSGVLTVEAPIPSEGNCNLISVLPDDSLEIDTWVRPFADGTCCSGLGPVSYNVYGPFTVDIEGAYTFDSLQIGWDGFIFLYQTEFDPLNPTVNYVAGNDDFDEVGTSQIISTLAAGTEYFFITTAFEAGEFGSFVNSISGPGTVTCGPLSTLDFDNANFKYYPNPVKDVLNLSYISNISSVSVVNLLGQQMISKNINANESQLDLSMLSAGTYLVKVTTEDNLEKIIKIVKQ